jgi:hypothetical protein
MDRIAGPALLQIGIDQKVYERYLHLAGKALPPALRPFDGLLRAPGLREELRDFAKTSRTYKTGSVAIFDTVIEHQRPGNDILNSISIHIYTL